LAQVECPQCGATAPEGTRFCGNCGARIHVELETEADLLAGPGDLREGRDRMGTGGAGGPYSADVRSMAMFCHLAAFAGFFLPFGNIIGPLIVWLVKREDSDFIDRHGKEAVNFQITMSIALFVSVVLILIVIGLFALIALAVMNLVFIIVAAMKANDGEEYRYPISVRFIR